MKLPNISTENSLGKYMKIMIFAQRISIIIVIPLAIIMYGIEVVRSLFEGDIIRAILILAAGVFMIFIVLIPLVYALDFTYKHKFKK